MKDRIKDKFNVIKYLPGRDHSLALEISKAKSGDHIQDPVKIRGTSNDLVASINHTVGSSSQAYFHPCVTHEWPPAKAHYGRGYRYSDDPFSTRPRTTTSSHDCTCHYMFPHGLPSTWHLQVARCALDIIDNLGQVTASRANRMPYWSMIPCDIVCATSGVWFTVFYSALRIHLPVVLDF